MARYDYRCHDCQQVFYVERSMSESRDDVACVWCNSSNIFRQFHNIGFQHKGKAPESALTDNSSYGVMGAEDRCHDCGKTPEEQMKAVSEMNS